MYGCILKKFEHNPELSRQLIVTGNMDLVEATPNTKWGAGVTLSSRALKEGTWTRKNKQGRITMTVRDTLKIKLGDELENSQATTEVKKIATLKRTLPTLREAATAKTLPATSTPKPRAQAAQAAQAAARSPNRVDGHPGHSNASPINKFQGERQRTQNRPHSRDDKIKGGTFALTKLPTLMQGMKTRDH